MNFRKIEFDGIFLDRIRFPSFTIGKEALFTCCCSECMKAYETRGWTKDRIINTKYSVERGGGKGLPLGIIKYMKGRYEFENVDIAEYLEIRMGLITEIVKRAAPYFKQRRWWVRTIEKFPGMLILLSLWCTAAHIHRQE